MVMHARKPQRISDGYFDKHQAHQYQSTKYNSKLGERRVANEYVGSDGRYSPIRSPNGNISAHSHRHSSHSHHHYSHSPEVDRSYAPSRSSYLHKICEKERDRDYKSSRDKYSDSIRSPKEKRSKNCERERSNHERSDVELKKRASSSSKHEKRTCSGSAVSEWTEHISSSGKVYYYNSNSEVSQWEKPRDWESRRSPKESRSQYATSSRNYDKRVSSHSSRDCDRTSDLVHSNEMSLDRRSKRSSGRSYWVNARSGREEERPRRSRHSGGHEVDGHLMQDMDISPSCSTPVSEMSYSGANDGNGGRGRSGGNNPSGSAAPNSGNSGSCNTTSTPPSNIGSNQSMAPRQMSSQQPHHLSKPQSQGQQQQIQHQMAPQLNTSLLAAALPRITQPPNGNSPSSPIRGCNRSNSPPLRTSGRNSSPPTDPPTPTHSELTDQQLSNIGGSGGIVVLDNALPRKWDNTQMAGSIYNHHHGLHSTPVPPLTPSLVNYLRNDLTGHVAAWPAEILEKQANKLMEDAHQVGSLMCTRVSAELKCARSLVRHTEIQATLQEQKLMYLRQQISRLEELKSQNSFMSEDV